MGIQPKRHNPQKPVDRVYTESQEILGHPIPKGWGGVAGLGRGGVDFMVPKLSRKKYGLSFAVSFFVSIFHIPLDIARIFFVNDLYIQPE